MQQQKKKGLSIKKQHKRQKCDLSTSKHDVAPTKLRPFNK